jgi:two-component system response regulator HydG
MTGEHVTEKQLPLNIARESPDVSGAGFVAISSSGDPRSLQEIERDAILETLKAADGNKSEAARRLGITRKTLHSKLKNYQGG